MAELLPELPGPIAVVCHDAGAANIILALLQASPERSLLPVMQGPAARLWEAGRGNRDTLLSLDEAIERAGSVLTGTGWASDLEHVARRRARDRRLPCAAVIDHWVNYAERFERDGQIILPDQLWVTDLYALAKARVLFPGEKIVMLPNLYLADQIRAITPPPANDTRVLYVLEPLRYTWPGLSQPGEFEALDFFIKNLTQLGIGPETTLRLRPHPSDPQGKYDAWIEQHKEIDVALDDSTTLAEAISRSSWVAGCETAALVVALGAGRKVIITLPPGAPECRLPHEGLIRLRQFAGTSSPATSLT